MPGKFAALAANRKGTRGPVEVMVLEFGEPEESRTRCHSARPESEGLRAAAEELAAAVPEYIGLALVLVIRKSV